VRGCGQPRTVAAGYFWAGLQQSVVLLVKLIAAAWRPDVRGWMVCSLRTVILITFSVLGARLRSSDRTGTAGRHRQPTARTGPSHQGRTPGIAPATTRKGIAAVRREWW
jgi:hypothetical protein